MVVEWLSVVVEVDEVVVVDQEQEVVVRRLWVEDVEHPKAGWWQSELRIQSGG